MKLSDADIISRQYKIATFFGFPLVCEVTTPKLKRICSKCYSVLIFFAYFFFTLACLFERTKSYRLFTPIEAINNVLQICSEIFFLSVCLLWPEKRYRYWKTFWRNLRLLDQNLKKLSFEEVQNTFVCGTITSVCFAIIFSVQFWEILTWYNMGKYTILYSYMNFRIAMYYHLYATILICQITRMFKVRFEFLNRYLHKVGSKKHILWDVSQTEANLTIHRLQEISKLFARMHELIKIFNNVLSWHICFIITSTILATLSSVNFGITVLSHESFKRSHISTELIIINVAYSAIYLVSAF